VSERIALLLHVQCSRKNAVLLGGWKHHGASRARISERDVLFGGVRSFVGAPRCARWARAMAQDYFAAIDRDGRRMR